jgi:hypothetical protein
MSCRFEPDRIYRTTHLSPTARELHRLRPGDVVLFHLAGIVIMMALFLGLTAAVAMLLRSLLLAS